LSRSSGRNNPPSYSKYVFGTIAAMPSRPKPIFAAPEPTSFANLGSSLSRSWAPQPLVQQALERDFDAFSDSEDEYDSEDDIQTPIAASAPSGGQDLGAQELEQLWVRSYAMFSASKSACQG
jgi:hypothetical protein